MATNGLQRGALDLDDGVNLNTPTRVRNAQDLLDKTADHIGKRNGSFPLDHEVVYALRIAVEHSGFDPSVTDRAVALAVDYNARTDRGRHIQEIPLYQNTDGGFGFELKRRLNVQNYQIQGGN